MSVHPFARRCDEIIEYLRDILANLRKAKKKVKEKEPPKRKGVSDGFFSLPALRLLGSHEMEQQGQVTGSTAGLGGDITNYKGKKKKPIRRKSDDPNRDRLLWAYQDAMERCRDKNLKENEAFYRCRAEAAKDGSSGKECNSKFVPMRCPEGVSALEALHNYEKSKGDGNDDGNSGGGGGGGF